MQIWQEYIQWQGGRAGGPWHKVDPYCTSVGPAFSCYVGKEMHVLGSWTSGRRINTLFHMWVTWHCWYYCRFAHTTDLEFEILDSSIYIVQPLSSFMMLIASSSDIHFSNDMIALVLYQRGTGVPILRYMRGSAMPQHIKDLYSVMQTLGCFSGFE